MRSWMLSVLAVVAAALSMGASQAHASDPIPPELKATLARVSAAAAQRDYNKLRDSMVEDFVWSFGGDADKEQAIAEWKTDPQYLKDLGRVTRAKCAWIDRGVVQCPAKSGTASRAGFKQVGGTWRFVYFVAGD